MEHGFGTNTVIAAERWIAYGAVDGGTREADLQSAQIADFTLDRRLILAMTHHEQTGRLAAGDGHGYI